MHERKGMARLARKINSHKNTALLNDSLRDVAVQHP